MAHTVFEIAKLALRCSFVETVREFLSTRLAFFCAKKSPYSTDPPAVCVIVENSAWGGTEQHTRDLIHWLLEHDMHVKYVTAGRCNGDPELTRIENYAFQWFNLPLSVEDVSSRRAWIRALRRIKSHAVILPCPRVEFGSFAFLGALRRSFRRVIYIEQLAPTPLPEGFQRPNWSGLLTAKGRADWIEQLRRRYRMRCADRIVAVSDEVADRLTDQWFAPSRQLSMVPNSVSDRWQLIDAASRRDARQAQGIAPDALVFGMMTRLDPVKGVDLALRAFAQFALSNPTRDALLVIAGQGPQEKQLKQLAEQLNIADRVRWLGFQAQPLRAYRLMDAILMPSRAEGLPLVLLEAMACGLVPITSDASGMPQVIEDPSLGWCVPREQVEPLVEAMRAAAALSAEQREAFSVRVHQHVGRKFDLDANLHQLFNAAGLAGHAAWNRTYLFSKIRDMVDAWLEYVRLWWSVRSMPELPRSGVPRSPRPVNEAKPPVCIIEESNGWGGAENHTSLLIQHLMKHQYPVEYVRGKDSLPVPPQGLDVIDSPVSVLENDSRARHSWADTFSRVKSKVVVFPALDTEFGMSLSLMKAMRSRFDRIIYIEHTLPPALPQNNPKRYLKGLIPGVSLRWRKEHLRRKLRMRCPSHIIAVSESVRQHFIENWHCPPEKILTVCNGVDCDKFHVTDEQRRAARETHDLPDSAIVFGMMSRLNPEKGVDLAVRAFAAYRALEPQREAYLVVGGTGPEADALQALGEDLGVADHIRWAGFIKDTVSLFALMDVLLATSRVEGLPLALLEGMATGAIPIVFRVGGMPEVVSDPSLGWVIEPGDVDGVARAMQEVALLSPEQIGAYRTRVRRCTQERFDLEVANGRIAQIIEHG